MSKIWGISVVMAAILTAGVVSAGTELRINGEGVVPGDSDTWDIGYGGSADLIFWSDANIGFGICGGAQLWNINDDLYSDGAYLGSGIGYGVAAGLEGDALMVPVGASLFLNLPLGDAAGITLEGGVRYVIVNSNIEFVYAEAVADIYGNYLAAGASYDVEIDNGVVGLLGADFELNLDPTVRLFAGAGYQFDIMKGDVTIGGWDIGAENELKAFVARAGLSMDI